MKKFLVLAVLSVLVLALFSCSSNKKQAEANAAPYELDNLLAVADQKVDETISVVGYVTHTCKHSGKKCFIVGESQHTSLRVMAGGEIETFSSELVGSKLSITGILKEEHLSEEYIAEMEGDVIELQKNEEMAEVCATELSNISEMRQWMKDHEKDYYVIYYMEGLKYEVVD